MLYGKDMSTLGSFEVSDKNITGEANKIEGWTQFAQDPSKQTGYYLALTVDPWEDVQINTDKNPVKKDLSGDGDVVLFLGAESIDVKSITFTPKKQGDPVTYTVSITAAEAV